MEQFTSDLVRTFVERGYTEPSMVTKIDELDEKASEGVLTAYIGFDCTAPSLHVGSLLPIMLLRRLQQAGHKPIVLMGSGTTRIGDPSGKDEARQLLTDDVIDENMKSIRKVFDRYLTFGDGPTDAVMVDNADWLLKLNYVDFLRDVGKHFSINRMLAFDSVKLRLDREQPLSFLEFNYMIFQGYDFVELYKRFGCTLQMGGSDQWGNIINGVELGRRMEGADLFGLTTPLLTTASGAKMGKTAAGAVWLNEDALPAYDFWQYWRNTDDADVGRFLRLFTDLPIEECARLAALEGAEVNEAKKILAHEVTKLAHGEQAAINAAETARKTFEQGASGADLPTITVSADALADGLGLLDAMVSAGFAKSKGEARRLVRGGGARINGEAQSDETRTLTGDDLADGEIKLSAGKKRHARIVIG